MSKAVWGNIVIKWTVDIYGIEQFIIHEYEKSYYNF